MSIPNILEKQILATVVYYDILNYPLTSFEIFLYLIKGDHCERRKDCGNFVDNKQVSLKSELLCFSNFRNNSISLMRVIKALDNSEYLKKHLDQKFGFYFLKNIQGFCNDNNYTDSKIQNNAYGSMKLSAGKSSIDIVQQRLNRKKIADDKWKKAKKIFWVMQIIPFMKMVLVSGSLAIANSKDKSDIDIIIITKKGRIWMVRTFATLLTSILKSRRHQNKTKNRICLNHYITDESLKIPFESLYNAQSYVHLINAFDSEEDKELFKEFQKQNNWIKKYILNYQILELKSWRSVKRNVILSLISKFFNFILSGRVGDFMENKLAVVQSRRIQKDPLCKKTGGRITINQRQLEFHPDSHESYIIPEFNKRMKSLELFEFADQKDSGLNV